MSRSILQRSDVLKTDGHGIRYLSVADLVDLHQAVAAQFGGDGGEIDSEFGLQNAAERPRATVFGRDAYPRFFEKAAAFFFAMVQNLPFQSANKRLAVASLMAFCGINGRSIDFKVLDEKTVENLVKKAATYSKKGIPPEDVFREIRTVMYQAISPPE